MDHIDLRLYSRTVLLLLSLSAFLSTSLSLDFEDISKSHNRKIIVENSEGTIDIVDSNGSDQQEFCYDATSEGCHRGPVYDGLSTGEDEPAAPRHDGGADGDVTEETRWDERGYVTLRPRMGNFGNQMELILGILAFAKALDRTLIMPHFHGITYLDGQVHNLVKFSELFQIYPLLEFHRVITMEEFLNKLAPRYWPSDGQRKCYVYRYQDDEECNQADCLGDLDPPVEFDKCILHKLPSHQHDITDEKSMLTARNIWNSEFPVEEHPVLTLIRSASAFPVKAGNRQIQQFVKWNEHYMTIARSYINATFGNDTWVGLHLRNGGDWVKACIPERLKTSFIMASEQCHDKKPGAVSEDMCLPSLDHMLELTLKVVKDVKAKHLFVATDKHPYLEDFRKELSPIGVSVHHLNPKTPQVDLVILGQADLFIGTCPSTFTSFVKRERDASGKPSIFWGQEYVGV